MRNWYFKRFLTKVGVKKFRVAGFDQTHAFKLALYFFNIIEFKNDSK